MSAYYIAFGIAILSLGLANMTRRDSEIYDVKAKVISFVFVASAIVSLTLLIGLRSENVGIDTKAYIRNITDIESGVFDVFEWNSPAYYYLVKIVLWIWGNSYTPLFILSGFICATVLCVTLYRYCMVPWLGLFIIISFGYYFEAINQIREFIAASIVLLSYQYLSCGRTKAFIITVMIASSFHLSALVAILAWPISKVEITSKILIGIAIFCIVCYANPSMVKEISEYIPFYGGYASWNLVDFRSITAYLILFFRLSLFLFTLRLVQNPLYASDSNRIQTSIVLFGLVFQTMTLCATGYGRIATYFMIVFATLIPNVLMHENALERRGVIRLATVIILTSFLIGNMSIKGIDSLLYEFYWEI